MFMLAQKVQTLIGLSRPDLHCHIMNIVTKMVTEFGTMVDSKLVRMIANIKDVTNGMLSNACSKSRDETATGISDHSNLVQRIGETPRVGSFKGGHLTKGIEERLDKNVVRTIRTDLKGSSEDFGKSISERVKERERKLDANNCRDKNHQKKWKEDVGKVDKPRGNLEKPVVVGGKMYERTKTVQDLDEKYEIDKGFDVVDIEELFMANARLFEQCAILYEKCMMDVNNKREEEELMKKRNEALLFVLDNSVVSFILFVCIRLL